MYSVNDMVRSTPSPRGTFRTSWLPVAPLLPAALVVIALSAALLPVTVGTVVLLALGAGLVVLIQPWLGLLLLAALIPWASVQPLPLGGVPLDAADLLLMLVAAVWLARGVVAGEITLPQPPLRWPLTLLLGALLLALIGAQSYREGLPELFKWAEVLALYVLVVALLPRHRVGWLLAALLLGGVSQALLGVYQFVTQTGPEAFVLMGRFMRAYGTLRQPNPFAGYLGLLAPLALSLTLWAWQTRQPQALRQAVAAAAGLIVLGILVSWSRGAWLAFAAATLVLLLVYARRSAVRVLIGLAVAAALLAGVNALGLLPAAVVQRLADLQNYFGWMDITQVVVTDDNFSVVERLAHWQAALGMWRDHAWLGVGPGNYSVLYPVYQIGNWDDPLGHAHNIYLNFAAEAGLVGLLAYLVFWLASLWQAARAAWSNDKLAVAVGAGVLGALTHATIHNLFDNLWVQHIYLLPALLLGVLVVLAQPRPAAPSQ